MKSSTLAFATLFLAAASISHAGIIRVYLQGGQSNADGRALVSGLPLALQSPQADVPFYYYYEGGTAPGTLTTLRPGASETGVTNFGPEVTFGRTLADAAPAYGVTVAIIKFANGGTNLATQWKAGGNATTTNDGTQYVTFQNTVNAGLAALAAANPTSTLQLAGMTWVQGESDIDGGAAMATPYGTNLINFISDVRLTFGADLPFFLSRISDNQTVYSAGNATVQANYNSVRSGQALAASTLTNVHMIDTDPASFTMKTDNLHFDAGGQQMIGSTFAQTAIAANTLPEPAGMMLLCAGMALLAVRRRAVASR